MERVQAIFPNKQLASAAIKCLLSIGINKSYKLISLENHDDEASDDYVLQKLYQGDFVLNIEVNEDEWIFVYEIVHSFAGELNAHETIEVMNRMYNIRDDEAYEEHYDSEEVVYDDEHYQPEVGTYGYPYDLLNDAAYIDPNIGLGNYDLLLPVFDPEIFTNNNEEQVH